MADDTQLLSDATWERFQRLAEQNGEHPDTFLNRLLDQAPGERPHRYRYMDACPTAVVIVDVSKQEQPIIYANPAFERETGYSADEILGRNLNFLQADDRDQPGRKILREAIANRQSVTVTLRNYRKDGAMFWNEISIAPVLEAPGQPIIHYIGIQQDITERVRVNQAIIDQEHKLALALRASGAGVWVWDAKANVMHWDAAMEAIHGLEPGTFGGQHSDWQALVHPDDLQKTETEMGEALNAQDSHAREFRIIRPDGAVRHIHAQSVFVKDPDTGELTQVVGVNRDITERKRAEAALRESEAQLKWVIENMPVMVDAFDENYDLIFWNKRCEAVTGYAADEMVGNPHAFELLYPDPEYRQYVEERGKKLGYDEREQLFTLTCKDGTERTIIWSNVAPKSPIPGWHVWAVGIDVTEQHRAEQALRESEVKYRLLVENSHQGTVIAQANPLRLTFASSPTERIVGFTPDELMGMTSAELTALIHPEDRERFFVNFRARLANARISPNDRYRLMHRDGTVRYVDVYSVRIDFNGEPATQTVLLDVTEQVEAERLKSRFLQEQERNVLIQRVISMLSHDLRTPLAVIASSRDMLDHYGHHLTPESRQQKLNTISRQVNFAMEMLQDTINTVRGPLNTHEYAPQPVNLAILCQVSVEQVRLAHDSPHEILFNNYSRTDVLPVDEVLVSRILINLLSNAIKYSPEDSKICLEMDSDDEWVILRVIDEGMGIHTRDLPHIFEAFYRTDNVQHLNGTGLGLSIVKDCVDRHRGTIDVESTPDEGSTFTVRLPLMPD